MPMTNKEKKKWLWRYRENREIFRVLSEQAKIWRETADELEEAGGEDPGDRFLEATLGARECELCFSDWCDQAACVCAEVWNAISKLPSNEALILTLRYIDGLQWDTVADRLGISERYIRSIHESAVERIDCENAAKTPPNLRYRSDLMFNFMSTANILDADTGDSQVYKGKPSESFFE